MTRERLAAAFERWRAPIWLALSVVGVAAVPYIVWANRGKPTIVGFDAAATYMLDFSNLYGIGYMDLGSFRYTPAYAQAFGWVHVLPWELFATLWIGAAFAILAWWGRWWVLALVAFPPVALELYHGNVHLFMAAAMVIGFRYPSAWAFPLLAKVTPGIGLLWFVGRRDWRSLAIAVATTAAIVAVSFLVAPDLWRQWLDTMRDSLSFVPPRRYPIDIPFTVRAPIAAAVALWGGWTNRRWTVPVAATLALPIVWVHGLAMLVAVIPLLRLDTRTRPVPAVASARRGPEAAAA
ncbi:MAG: glycosyltransferase 87 family protein [Chloroflexota bacterium]